MPAARPKTGVHSLALLALLAGCSGDPPPTPDVKPAAEKPKPAASPEPVEPKEERPVVETTAAYEPPFANRTNLFAPAPRKKQAKADDRESEDSVVLKGFADVGGRCAVLRINGEICPLTVGSTRHGVQVISIDPPECVLQRGRTRWTTSL